MVDVNGYPRNPDDLGRLRRRLDALESLVRLQTSARTYVTLERIVEGGTIGAVVGDKLTETVQDRIIVTGENLSVDALDGRVITGSTFRTSDSDSDRTQIDDEGVVVHGHSTAELPAPLAPVPFRNRAVLTQRATPWSWSVLDKWPGLWFEGEREDGAVPPFVWPAGVAASGSDAQGMSVFSARESTLDRFGEFAAGRDFARITYNGPQTAANGDRDQTSIIAGDGYFRLAVRPKGGQETSIYALGDGRVNITAPDGVYVNGQPVNGGGGTSEALPLVITSLNGNDQPSVADNDVAIRWNGARGDTLMWGGNFNPAYPTRLYATKPGEYFLTGNVTFSNMGGGMRGVWFRVNGSQRVRGQSNPPPSAAQMAEIDAHNYAWLAAGDYIEVMATVAGASGAVSIKANQGTSGAIEWKRP